MHPDDRLAEELAQSASALRSLARDLTGPGDDADDLVQETMLRAWRSPPRERHGLRPWLSTILRNLASNHRRDERRRKRREQEHDAERAAAAGGDPCEPETLRAVTEALWQLPEPYQRTLTLRYFAGRTPTEIAEQTASPLPTVKSRLRRGLQMLRERLERERGSDWRAALCVATGLPLSGAAAATATTASVLLMAHTSKFLFGTAAVAVATWLLWPDAAPTLPPAAATTTPAASAAVAQLIDEAPAAPIEREDAARTAAGANVDLGHPFSYELRCRVVDRDGLIVPNATVAVAPLGGHLNQWLEPTGDDGEVTLSWHARVPTMTVQVGLLVLPSAEALREVEVHAGADNQVALLHASGGSSNFCQAARLSSMQSCTACHVSDTGSRKLFDAPLSAAVGLHPFGRFRDRTLDDTGKRHPGFVMPTGPELEITVEPSEEAPAPGTRVEGTVRDAQGRPVVGATVIWSQRRDLPRGRTKTDKQGVYRFEHVRDGEVEVRAGGGADGIARHTIEVVPESHRTLDLYLAPERTLSGTVILPEQASADGWMVEYVARDTSWVDGVVMRGNEFRLANLPSQQGALLLWSPTGRLPVAIEPNALPAAGVTFDLTMQGLPNASLQLSLPDDDERVYDLAASVYQVASGRGATMTRQDHTFTLGHLPPGRYRVRLFGPQIGVLDLGEHFVDGVTTTDLGVQTLPEPSLLRVERGDDRKLLELYQRRRELDVLAAPVRPGQFEFLLPAGEWLLLWGDADAPRTRLVTAGREPTTVDLR